MATAAPTLEDTDVTQADTPAAHPAAFDAAEAVCKRHARSFHFASYFLPKVKRRDAFAVYAFCRMVDDAVDETPGGVDAKKEAVDRFDHVLERLYAGSLPDGFVGERAWVLEAFADVTRRRRIPIGYFHDLLEGVRMDLVGRRYETWADLKEYCYHVAGCVGLMMCHVFGLDDEDTDEDRRIKRHAIAYGEAMQLTNILRDVGEDLERGRLYLPQADMDKHKVDVHDLDRREPTPAFASLMRYEIERALDLYREGAAGLHYLPEDGSRQTAAVMGAVYAGILGEIERNDFDVFTQRASLTLPQKMARLPMARRLAKRRPNEVVPQVFKLVTRGTQP